MACSGCGGVGGAEEGVEAAGGADMQAVIEAFMKALSGAGDMGGSASGGGGSVQPVEFS